MKPKQNRLKVETKAKLQKGYFNLQASAQFDQPIVKPLSVSSNVIGDVTLNQIGGRFYSLDKSLDTQFNFVLTNFEWEAFKLKTVVTFTNAHLNKWAPVFGIHLTFGDFSKNGSNVCTVLKTQDLKFIPSTLATFKPGTVLKPWDGDVLRDLMCALGIHSNVCLKLADGNLLIPQATNLTLTTKHSNYYSHLNGGYTDQEILLSCDQFLNEKTFEDKLWFTWVRLNNQSQVRLNSCTHQVNKKVTIGADFSLTNKKKSNLNLHLKYLNSLPFAMMAANPFAEGAEAIDIDLEGWNINQ